MSGLVDTAASAVNQIGKYFSVASFVPALLFVLWLMALAGGAEAIGLRTPFFGPELEGAPATPTLEQVATAMTAPLGSWSPEQVAGVLVATVVLSLGIHPLLFATTQLLEGYWGTGPVGLHLALWRAAGHRRRRDHLAAAGKEARATARDFAVRLLLERNGADAVTELKSRGLLSDSVGSVLASPDGLPVFAVHLKGESLSRAAAVYPHQGHRVMPTRLGNALRRIEDSAGRPYGLSVVSFAPHLTLTAAPERRAYIADSRQGMDVAIRLTFFALLAAVITTMWWATAGWYVVVALVPYGFAYVAYRGAVAAAEEWGAAIVTAVDLDRFAMYEAMHVDVPDSATERVINANLAKARSLGYHLDAQYRTPEPRERG